MTTLDYRTLPPAPRSKMALIVGWIISALPVLMMLMSAYFKFAAPPFAVEGTAKLGWPQKVMVPLGIVEASCALLFLFPRTAFIGAILVTGYLGGATATHVRVGQPFLFPVLLGILAWVGLLLRDSRLRVLLPV